MSVNVFVDTCAYTGEEKEDPEERHESVQKDAYPSARTLQALLSFPREPFEIVTFALATHGTTVAFRTSNQRDTGVVYAHVTQLKSRSGVDWFACSRIDISIALFLSFEAISEEASTEFLQTSRHVEANTQLERDETHQRP